MNRAIEDSLSLIAGAGVGMAVMYLLDPESGPKRRRTIAKTARQTFDGASDSLMSAADSARDAMSSSTSRLSDYSDSASRQARRAMSRLSSLSSDLGDSASETASNASDSVSSFGNYAGSIGAMLAGRARHMMPRNLSALTGRRRSSEWSAGSVAGYTGGGLGLVVLGAGLAYLLDPARGRGRRAYLLDKVTSATTDAGDFMWKMGRRVSNQMQGTVAQGRAMLRSEQVTDRQLEERVRSQLGHLEGGRNIEVSAADGIITLRSSRTSDTGEGSMSQEIVDAIVSAASGIRGVRSVNSQLRSSTSSTPTAQ